MHPIYYAKIDFFKILVDIFEVSMYSLVPFQTNNLTIKSRNVSENQPFSFNPFGDVEKRRSRIILLGFTRLLYLYSNTFYKLEAKL